MESVREQKQKFWKDHIQEWQGSGLSQSAYCEAHGIKLATFLYYRHRLSNSNDQPTSSVNFVAIQPKAVNMSQPVAAWLMLPNGIRIGVSSDISEPLLKLVLNVAGQTHVKTI